MNKPQPGALCTVESVESFIAEVLVELCDETYPPRYTNDRLKTMIYGAKVLAELIESSSLEARVVELEKMLSTRTQTAQHLHG